MSTRHLGWSEKHEALVQFSCCYCKTRGPHSRGVQSRIWIAKSVASNVGKLGFLQLWPRGKGER